MHIFIKMLKGSHFLLLRWIVGVWMLYASVQVAEGLAKLPLFPCSCGLTGRRKNRKKRTDYNSTITSLHCTTKANPSIPMVGEKEERTALTTITTTTTTDRQWEEHRWEEGGGGGRGRRKVKCHERREEVLPSNREVSRWAEYGEERGEKRRKEEREGGLVIEGVEGGRVEGRVYLIGDPGGTPLPEA